MQPKGRALDGRELFDEGKEGLGLFAADKLHARIRADVIRSVGGGNVFSGGREHTLVAAGAAPVLDVFPGVDAEEPRGKFLVLAQTPDATDSGGEGFLDDIESGGFFAEEFGDVGVKRQPMSLEQGIPASGCMVTGGGDELG